MIYRPRTPTVEAHQYMPASIGSLIDWLGYAWAGVDDGEIIIENRSGRVRARPGDWIVHEDDGFYPMGPELFHAQYEEAPQ